MDLLAEILGISEDDADYEIAAEATPLYQATALSAMKSVLSGVSSADDAWDIIEARREELLLPEINSKELLASIVMQAGTRRRKGRRCAFRAFPGHTKTFRRRTSASRASKASSQTRQP